ncbi:MAG: hypothetical protein A3K10_14235 [Bacteroidetes bacterium RIFCSPLOWO2_12_FULL_31_6]|nr:MAG: hypothetical protein A3K10_14235 [Bacteroidetes bacterium RIFCSPLOWO2_12_FULL_31_6]
MVGLLSFSYYSDKKLKFENWETESSLFVIHENKHYDIMIMGNSHGRQFSRGSNHKYFEEKTGKKMINVARGLGGGGISNMLINLEYFYQKNNSVDTILYFIDPYIFYYEEWNEASLFLDNEPLDPLYFELCFKNNISKNSLVNYVRTKFSDDWLYKEKMQYHFNSLTKIDSTAVTKRLQALYIRAPQEKDFLKYALQVERIIQLAKTRNTKIIFTLSPTLLGEQPQTKRLLVFLCQMQNKYGINYFNHYDKVKNTTMFTDHDHLNDVGMKLYINFINSDSNF